MSSSFQIDSDYFVKALEKAVIKIQKTKGVVNEIGETLVKNTKVRFENGIGADGKRWEKSEKRSGKTMIDTGNLKNSISFKVSKNSVELTDNTEYGKYLQKKRPFLGITKEDIKDSKEIVSDFLKDCFK